MSAWKFRPPGKPWRAALLILLAAAAIRESTPPAAAESGFPVPRFVSLRAETVNLRTGPGVRYPVEWVFRRRGLSVEVVAEFETWRKVQDREGVEGWVHQSMLSGRRFAVVAGEVRGLREDPEETAGITARVEPGVIGRILRCTAGQPWCRLSIAGHKGWLRRDEIWGVYPDEAIE